MITNDWGRGERVFFIKILVVDKSEFAPLIGNWPWLRGKNCCCISSVSNAWEIAQQIA